VPGATYGLETFTDGLWHSVSLDVIASQGSSLGKVTVTVDGRPDISTRQLTFTSAPEFLIGGTLMLTWPLVLQLSGAHRHFF